MRSLLLTIAVLSVAGCPRKSDDRPRLKLLEPVEVADRSRPDERLVGVTGEAVGDWVLSKLRGSRAVQVVKSGADTREAYHLSIEFGVGHRREDGAKKVILVSARGEVPGDLDRVILQASLVRTEVRVDPLVLRKAVETVVADILFQAELARTDATSLVRALQHERDAQRLAAAVDIAAVRRIRAAVPTLIKLLRHKNEIIADRAIGALVAIGDRRAVSALTRLTRFRNTEKMAKIIDGIGTLGGREAREYLELVASGHEDADIRNMAAEALARLRSHK